MAKVLFINPIIREQDKPRHIPYGFAQLVAIAIREGHKVQVFDANAWRVTNKEIREVLAADDWDVIATGGLITTYGFIKRTAQYAREICKNSIIIAGGGFLTPLPYEIMEFIPEIDIGVIGEAYETLKEILERVNEKDYVTDIKGIIYRDEKKRLHLNEERPLLRDVDSLPFPAWDLFPLDIYFKHSSLLLSEEAMLAQRHLGVMASYGCPFACKFCFHLGLSGELKTYDLNGKKQIKITSRRQIRHHSPAYVVDLVKYARHKFGIDFVSFLDENFAILGKNSKWFDEFSTLWRKAGLQPHCIKENREHDPYSCSGIHWGATAHAAVVTSEMLKHFRELGCSHLDYGLESFSDEILASIGKGSNSKLNEKAVLMTLKANIRPIPNQIIGFPDESFESILATVDAWNRLGIQTYPFFATPYPGSEWYDTFKDVILGQYGGNLEDYLLDLGDATKITAVISKNFNAVELLGLRELMVNRDVKRIKEYENYKKSNFVNPQDLYPGRIKEEDS
jgi:anaerobic magnesium-protoporphyrin IX monomethyl ester cyclase